MAPYSSRTSSKVAMRFCAKFVLSLFLVGSIGSADAFAAPAKPTAESYQIEISADQSLEWHAKKSLYLAKGAAQAISGDLKVSADLLTAHKRTGKLAKGTSEIDLITAEGSVVVTKGNARITGDKAIHKVDDHAFIMTGRNLRYESNKHVVTARDSLEYWDLKKQAIAKGNAVATSGDRRITGDTLTVEFRDQPNGQNQLSKMTAQGHVTVVTKSDVVRGDKGVYDAARDMAIVTGNVRISRADGTELIGDIAEADFAKNQSRLINSGKGGRVRALLPARSMSTPAPKAKKR